MRLSLLLCFLLPSAVDAESSWEPSIHRIIHLSLDEDFASAHALADSVMHAHPDRPEPAFYKAVIYWRQGMNRQDGTKYDPDVLRYVEATIERAEQRMRRHGESADLFLWLGNAYGLRTGLEMLRRQVFKGIVDGFQGREYLTEALEIDPDLVDARFGLGLSDYILATKPRILRIVQRLFNLPSGDRKGGIASLERVTEEGRFTVTDARSALAYIDLYYERDRRAAFARVQDLLTRYPNSLDYRIRLADTMLALTFEEGDSLSSALVDSVRSIRAIARDRGWELIGWRRLKLLFTEGAGLYRIGRHAEARARLTRVAATHKDDDNWLIGPTELLLGKLADLSGDRETAKTHYARSERREDVWGSFAEARRLQIRPFDGQEPSQRPKDDEQRYPERP